jgi:isoquinoline 1-oxidoreductase alpha subunit
MIHLKVNNQDRQFDGDPDMPLLWFLRDELDMTGTKFGCGAGLCGACTVHRNGEAIRSCSVKMSEVAGRSILTIEGLAAETANPIRKALLNAWQHENTPQCGYCQPGQIMQAAALLKKTRRPSDKDIDDAMSGNICRCGTYQRIRAAVHAAAKEIA